MCLNKKIPQRSSHLVCMKPTILSFAFWEKKKKQKLKLYVKDDNKNQK